MKAFWDTNLFIYLIERHPTFHGKVVELYQQLQREKTPIATSTLPLGELIAQPLRRGRDDLAGRCTELLTRGAIELIDFTREAAEHYGRIRAATSLRQPDALQLACAAAGGATVFLTNDEQLWNVTVPGIPAIRGL